MPSALLSRLKPLAQHARWIGIAVLGLLSVPVISFGIPEDKMVLPAEGFAVISRGPIQVTVQDEGEIQSSRNATVSSQCEWHTQLLWIVPEGTRVEAGDLVAQLDSSELEQKEKERQIRYVRAQAAYEQAREEYHIQELTNQSTLAQAELNEELTRLQFLGYEEAEYPQLWNDQASKVALAKQDLAMARKQQDFSRTMVRLGYRQQSDFESKRIATMDAEQKLHNAQELLRVLADYTKERQLTEYEGLYEDARRNLDRVEATNQAALVSRQITMQTAEQSLRISKSSLDRVRRSLAACKLIAPQAGVVVHGRYQNDSRTLEPGDRVWRRQELIQIPDRQHMQVELRIHESLKYLLRRDQLAEIRIDSLPEHALTGHIQEIANVPSRGRWPHRDRLEYRVYVEVENPLNNGRPLLTPGMSANVNIVVNQNDSALRAPLTSVVKVVDHYVAFVRSGEDVVAREVEVGLFNDEDIEIVSGLEKGDEVVVRPRSMCAARISRLRTRYLAETSGSRKSRWNTL